jgi:ketopantoate hydroxymethyltransferase
MVEATKEYIADVKDGKFPAEGQTSAGTAAGARTQQ